MTAQPLQTYWLRSGRFVPETGPCMLQLVGSPRVQSPPATVVTFFLRVHAPIRIVLTRPAWAKLRFDHPGDPAYSFEPTCDSPIPVSTVFNPIRESDSKELVFLACLTDIRPLLASSPEDPDPMLKIAFDDGFGTNITISFVNIASDGVEYTRTAKR